MEHRGRRRPSFGTTTSSSTTKTPTTTPKQAWVRPTLAFSPNSGAAASASPLPSLPTTLLDATISSSTHIATAAKTTTTTTTTTTTALGWQILNGLSFAGVAVCCLSTLFELFHVDVFLQAYRLPSTTYSVGRVLFSILSTASSVLASGWVDAQVATTRLERFELVGFSGLLLAIAFVLPFGRFWDWTNDNNSASTATTAARNFLDGLHFVVSMSLYDGMSTIVTILLASAVSDDHNMTDYERIQNAVGSQIGNLIASLVVANVGLQLFDFTALYKFQYFVIVLAVLSILVFGTAQSIINLCSSSGNNNNHSKKDTTTTSADTSKTTATRLWDLCKGWTVRPPHDQLLAWEQAATGSPTTATNTSSHNRKQRVVWKRALKDMWRQSNFRRWLVLEMLFEFQTHFVQTFFKTFVDQLLSDLPPGVSDWLLSLFRPLHQTMAIICYIPIRWYGYARVYTVLLLGLFLLSSITLLSLTPASTGWILVFLVVYAVSSEAVRSAGYYMAVSDLVLELKQWHAQQGRTDEPSLAAMLLVATTLFCKPVQSILPILAANMLHRYPDHEDPRRHVVLYYLLVVPPWICSLLQLYVWQHYDLHPKRTHEMRLELQYIKDQSQHQKQQQQHQQQQQLQWQQDGNGHSFERSDSNEMEPRQAHHATTGTHKRHPRRQKSSSKKQDSHNNSGHIMSV